MPRILNSIENRFAAVTKAQKKPYANKNAVDTVSAVLGLLGNNFDNVKPGQGMAFVIPAETTPKKFLASIRGKLVAVSREGQPWAGRQYKSAIDTVTNPDKPEVIVMRLEDGKALPRKVGGRPTKAESEARKAEKAENDAKLEALQSAANNDRSNDNDSKTTKTTAKTQIKDLTGSAQKAA